MTEEFTIHEISLGFPHDKEMLIRFLSDHELVFEDDIETAFGVFDQDETLLGCGCCAGNLLKCFAVDEALRGQNALGSLVSRLVENRFEAGHYDLSSSPGQKTRFFSHPAAFIPWLRPSRC